MAIFAFKKCVLVLLSEIFKREQCFKSLLIKSNKLLQQINSYQFKDK